jgi:tryptophan 2,3-dioxygenase
LIIALGPPIDRTPYDHAFEHLYWQAAGKDYTTGKNLIYYKNLNASIKIFSASMEQYNSINIWQKFKQLPDQDQNNHD